MSTVFTAMAATLQVVVDRRVEKHRQAGGEQRQGDSDRFQAASGRKQANGHHQNDQEQGLGLSRLHDVN